ncbi:ABC transporter permease [Salinactinospora qingdaonensis]|uniref:ABC transporter permease n=1 Tax=Salinactinospora qingdaonensis TaxID=702744 RepID=UPI0031EA873B
MSPAITAATALRILRQLRRDPRTVALLLVVPSLLLFLLRYVFNSEAIFNGIAPAMLAIFPFVMMFLVTSIATLRERQSGTLERLMTLPTGKLDLLVGYACAFTLVTLAQVTVAVGAALLLGFEVEGSVALLLFIAALDALLGVALGLLASAFARTEFQVVQFMPAFIMPQVLLCGLFAPREEMQQVLEAISWAMPLSYAVDAIDIVSTTSAEVSGDLALDVTVVAGCILLALVLAAATLRRSSP